MFSVSSLPEIQISGTRFVERGAHIYLMCNASGKNYPPSDVDWFKDGHRLNTNGHRKVSIQKQLSYPKKTIISSLEIKHSSMNDAGFYVCRTTGELTTRFKVDVLNGKLRVWL